MREKETVNVPENAPSVQRNYRDTVFRMLFREKKELLTLFNAVHGTSYENEEDLEVTTLENAVYMSMKNDLSCVLGMHMDLYEHQSTANPNMPLRDLFYAARLYENRVRGRELYSRKRITIPAPKFIVFYNGAEEQPERKECRLSDSFAEKEEVNLELVVLQLNINPGYNTELMEKCPVLGEYIQYTEQIRQYRQKMPLPEAVEAAVEHCIREGILADFLRKNRNEVIPMILYEYDEEGHMELLREEGREEGISLGMDRGSEQEKRQSAFRMIEDGDLPLEKIALYSGLTVEQVAELENEMQPV